MKECAYCRKEFTSHMPQQKFCSTACRVQNQNSRIRKVTALFHTATKECAACHTAFHPAHHAERYCSNECRYKNKIAGNRKYYYTKPAGIVSPAKMCDTCRQKFTPRNCNQKFCPECSRKNALRWSIIRARNDRFIEHLANGENAFDDL